ncbi:MAG: hypothetical protein ACI9SX_000147 [Pseudoalteromonas tetraodonis]|jgi:hypothetical protein
MLNQLTKVIVVSTLVLVALGGNVAHAFGSEKAPTHFLRHQSSSQLGNVLTPLRHSQNQKAKLRSRGDVMQEVKRRYDAKVLKITLNKQRQIYNVRVLMPNGKVRNIQVSAKR